MHAMTQGVPYLTDGHLVDLFAASPQYARTEDGANTGYWTLGERTPPAYNDCG